MSVVINTNTAASQAATNLLSANGLLARSLQRLSSGSKIVNPSDDAGGLAVSMKLSATIRRQQACQTNLANAVSYLQTQDGALESAGAILDRMSELQTLYQDVTKNATDRANYDLEFAALQKQLSALGGETFNSVSLFSSSTLRVNTTGETDGSILEIGGIDLLGGASTSSSSNVVFSDDFDDLSNWTDLNLATATGGRLQLTRTFMPSNIGTATTNATYSGAMEISFTLQGDGSSSTVVEFGNYGLDNIASADTDEHQISIVLDGAGGAEVFIDGTSQGTYSGVPTSGALSFMQLNSTSYIDDLTITSTSTSTSSGTGNVASVIGAGSLADLDLSTIKSAIQDVATYRAQNGAQQSRLEFATELANSNATNLEEANSRIADVDVALESTQLARYSILVQAATAMLGQANASSQSVLSLIA